MKTKQSILWWRGVLRTTTEENGCSSLFELVSLRARHETTHLNYFNLIVGSDCQPSTHILFGLIRNNCIEPTCTVTCIVYLSGGWYFTRSTYGKKNMIRVVMITTICCNGSGVFHTNALPETNRPVLNQQRHLEVENTAASSQNNALSDSDKIILSNVLNTIFIHVKAKLHNYGEQVIWTSSKKYHKLQHGQSSWINVCFWLWPSN